MEPLHGVLRAIRQLTPRRDDLSVFRKFLNHLDRIARPKKRAAAGREGRSRSADRAEGRSAATRRSRKMGRRVKHQDQKSEQSRKRP
jgi:hypothetical protein